LVGLKRKSYDTISPPGLATRLISPATFARTAASRIALNIVDCMTRSIESSA
jgi:hypothetical protein